MHYTPNMGKAAYIAPEELSFTDPEAFNDICGYRPRHGIFDEISTIINLHPVKLIISSLLQIDVDHARMRKVLGLAFTDKAIDAHSPLVRAYADISIHRPQELAMDSGKVEKCIIIRTEKWFNYFAINAIKDLACSESPGCLVRDSYHEWAATTVDYVTHIVLSTFISYLLLLETLSITFVPPKIVKRQYEHHRLSKVKIDRRLDIDDLRYDLINIILPQTDLLKRVGMRELKPILTILYFAGSEAPNTLLSNII